MIKKLPGGSVRATMVRDAFKSAIPGAVSFLETRQRGFWGWLKATCPCGCGAVHKLPIGINPKLDGSNKPEHGVDKGGIAATWEWDGDREAPSMHPSLNHEGHWHGWLKAGLWTDAD